MRIKTILAEPRGFCFGVKRAIDIVNNKLKENKKVYVLHQIVHNVHVVKDFEKKGVIFVDFLDDVPNGSVLILSAHGSPPEIKKKAIEKNLEIIDAVCPFVDRIHKKAVEFYKNGYSIIFIGKKGHQEVIGTMGYAPMHLVQNEKDVNNLNIQNNKITYLTQTTLSVGKTIDMIKAIEKKFPKVLHPKKEDICYATAQRQNAVKELAGKSDLVIVIGSKTSSNSNSLRDTAQKQGARSYLIDDYTEFKKEWLKKTKTIGITSGASAPEKLVKELKEYLNNMRK